MVGGRDGYRRGIREREEEARLFSDSRRDKNRGSADKAKGRAKETLGSLTGDKDLKSEGRGDQDKGTLKKKKGALKDLLG